MLLANFTTSCGRRESVETVDDQPLVYDGIELRPSKASIIPELKIFFLFLCVFEGLP